jgi:hypothetical protein
MDDHSVCRRQSRERNENGRVFTTEGTEITERKTSEERRKPERSAPPRTQRGKRRMAESRVFGSGEYTEEYSPQRAQRSPSEKRVKSGEDKSEEEKLSGSGENGGDRIASLIPGSESESAMSTG